MVISNEISYKSNVLVALVMPLTPALCHWKYTKMQNWLLSGNRLLLQLILLPLVYNKL